MNFSEAWSDTCSCVSHAAKIGNVTLLLKLLSDKASVDVADNRGWRPIHEAAATSPSIECLEILLKQEDTNINWTTHEGETALLLACKRRLGPSVNAYVSLLLQFKADPNIADNEEDTPLIQALRSGNLYVVEQLLVAGADVNATDWSKWSPLHEACFKADTELLQAVLKWNPILATQDGCGMTPIFTAVQHGTEECLDLLLAAAKEKNQSSIVNIGAKDYYTPLMMAAELGFDKCVATLLENGADPDLTTSDNATALHLAVQSDSILCLSMLLSKMKIQPLIKSFHPSSYEDNDMICPLHMAVEWGSYPCLKALLAAGFSPDSLCCCKDLPSSQTCSIRFPKVDTALSHAAFTRDSAAMNILLQAGASPNPINESVFHPLVRAIISADKTTFRILLESGTDINYRRGEVISNEVFLYSLLCDLSFMRTLLHLGCDPNPCFTHDRETLVKFIIYLLRRERITIGVFLKMIWRFLIHSKSVEALFVVLNEVLSERAAVHSDNIDEFLVELSEPSSLLQLCFLNIRRHLYSIHANKIPQAISRLCLPANLIHYLSCQDLIDSN